MHKKGMSAALTLVITMVVLIVVALALITITTGNLGGYGGNADQQNTDSSCKIWKAAACTGEKSGTAVTHPTISTCTCTCDGKSIKCP